MPVTLRRYIETTQGTLGQFVLEDNSTLYTMERQSVGEHPRIPAGLYELRLDFYHKGNYVAYQIIVPGRDRILIHVANRAVELLGCIAPGKAIGFLEGQLAVQQSLMAFRKFMDVMGGVQSDYLTIHNPQ
jgi:hypothetical protein